ncbi:unnamed protein product [Schistocephalus solidus]|uniref:C2H2-type domain-containing protein n=1 Tax=Schistocephalus solidus TaxID=70667 RepID=A0A183SYY1_SCHSO|nr:unnamed protein product [Schistocephalus solidus]
MRNSTNKNTIGTQVAPVPATNITCPTLTISVATSDYLPPATSNTITAPSTSDGDSVLNCPHCDRTFTSHIGMVTHLRIHGTQTGKLVPKAPTQQIPPPLMPHCPRAFTHGMGLLGHMRIHESGSHRDATGLFPAATPRAIVTTGGLNQVRVSGAVCASKPGISDSQISHLALSKSPTVGMTATSPQRLADHKISSRKTQTNNNTPRPHPPRHTLRAARKSPRKLAAWNVRSLIDNPRSNRPESRTALVTRKLARFKVDIAALSETRFSEQGQLEEVGAGYTFFWSGRPKAEGRDAGVAFAIRNDILGHLPCLPQETITLQPLSISPAHTAPGSSTHSSAWSVTCESITRRHVN